MDLDEDGRPLRRAFNAARLNERKIDELIGLCRGVLADGVIVQAEAEFLLAWMQSHRDVADHWPASVLYRRIGAMLEDGVLDEEEERELLDILVQATGGPIELGPEMVSNSSSLPLCSPAPEIAFSGRVFCFTGKFVTGPRRKLEELVLARGAQAKPMPTRETDYLVIGAVGSAEWIHSTHGRKIEKAVRLRERCARPSIVAEEHWNAALGLTG